MRLRSTIGQDINAVVNENIMISNNKNYAAMKNYKELVFDINCYTDKAKNKMVSMAKEFMLNTDSFKMPGINVIKDDLLSCIDELIKNAIKANYKFFLIKETMHKYFSKKYPEKSSEEIDRDVDKIIKDMHKYDTIARTIIQNENVMEIVRKILNEEAEYVSIKNAAYNEKRDISDKERKIIQGLKNYIYACIKVKRNGLKILIKVHQDEDLLFVEVTNTAPMLFKDIQRIYEKRNEFKKYREEKKEGDFFINNIDTSEAGFGFGYALIDAYISSWGLDPETTAKIIPSRNTSSIIAFSLAELKRNHSIFRNRLSDKS